jgi:putative transcriptional regulator
MGEKKVSIAEVSRQTGLNRNTITLLYKETATRIDLPAVDKLCSYFDCQVSELLEFIKE